MRIQRLDVDYTDELTMLTWLLNREPYLEAINIGEAIRRTENNALTWLAARQQLRPEYTPVLLLNPDEDGVIIVFHLSAANRYWQYKAGYGDIGALNFLTALMNKIN